MRVMHESDGTKNSCFVQSTSGLPAVILQFSDVIGCVDRNNSCVCKENWYVQLLKCSLLTDTPLLCIEADTYR